MPTPSQTAIRLVVDTSVIAAALFISAGTLNVPQFWLYLACYAIFWVISHLSLARSRLAEEVKTRFFTARSVYPLWGSYVHWFIAGLDRGVLHWSDTVPLSLQGAAFALMAAGGAFHLWAMHATTAFHAGMPPDITGGDAMIGIGPYRRVRHPSHVASFAIYTGSGLVLGSWLSILPLLPYLWMLPRATIADDRQLMNNLPGYREYAEQVRWRWIPGLW